MAWLCSRNTYKNKCWAGFVHPQQKGAFERLQLAKENFLKKDTDYSSRRGLYSGAVSSQTSASTSLNLFFGKHQSTNQLILTFVLSQMAEETK